MKLAYVLIFSWLMTLAAAQTIDLATLKPLFSNSVKAIAVLLGAAFSRRIIAAKSMRLIDAFSGGSGDMQVVR